MVLCNTDQCPRSKHLLMPTYDPCPDTPCEFCKGKAANGLDSWLWCQQFNVCAATIDWEQLYNDAHDND